ncbi:response regulator [Salinarchaeum laminariae]|uniref:response regulator n=1 Tax=Salinarchaeum laminariae TaxID=869888 RepID=UPI0020BE8BAF|nr:response regulator [Salinarchaeum laminariae]
MTETDAPVVLIVEDEPDVAETYQIWLQGSYDVRTAETGDAALAAVDDDVDVVLLDRMMPGMSGADVLSAIRSRGIDTRVAMVSAVDPDFDVVEMGFDEYVTKPPTRDGLLETIETLLDRAEQSEALQEYYSLVARRSALETEKTEAKLEDSEEYARLNERIDAQREEADETLGDMESDLEFVSAVRELSELTEDAAGEEGADQLGDEE